MDEEKESLGDIRDIQTDDPLELILEIDKRVRPSLTKVETNPDCEIVYTYHAAMKRACQLFGVEFDVPDAEDDYAPTARKLLYQTKAAIDRKKIDLLFEKKNRGVALDQSWREKIHSYLSIVRAIVEKAGLNEGIRDSILTRLHALDEEVDRKRTRVQKFNDALVDLCIGVSQGAEKLRPAVKLFERIVGAINRVEPKPEPTAALPAPDTLGLPAPTNFDEAENGGE